MKKLILSLFCFVMLLTITACSSSSKKEENVIKMGFVPLKNSEKLIDDVEPIAKALSEKLGVKVEAFTASNYIGVVEGIGSGSVDFGFIPPFAALLSEKQSGANALLTAKGSSGQPGYYAEIYVRNDSNINTLSDLKGKKVAFVDPSSSSGYIYPGSMLKNAGIDLDKDITYQFSGGHDKSLQLLLNKDVDAIGTFDGVPEKYEKDFPGASSKVRKLATSDLIPGVTIIANSKMNSEMQEKLKNALKDLENNEETKTLLKKLFNITGFEEVNKENYKRVEETAKLMNVDLDKVK